MSSNLEMHLSNILKDLQKTNEIDRNIVLENAIKIRLEEILNFYNRELDSSLDQLEQHKTLSILRRI